MDLAKLLNAEPGGTISTALGELCVFGLNMTDHRSLTTKDALELGEVDPVAYVRKLARLICYPPDRLREDKYKPKEPVLTEEDTAKLTTDDLERLSELYIEKHEYLTKESVSDRSKNDSGRTVVSFHYGETKYPRLDSETQPKYLVRLMRLQAEESTARHENLVRDLKRSFSSGLSESIAHAQRFGDILKGSFDRSRAFDDLNTSIRAQTESISEKLGAFEQLHESIPATMRVPRFDPSLHINLARSQREAQWAPFNMLAERIDQHAEFTQKAVEFAVEANKIQTSIAQELSDSGHKNEQLAERNLYLTRIVVGLTASGLLLTGFGSAISGYQLYESHQSGKQVQQQTQAYVDVLGDKLDKIAVGVSQPNGLQQEVTRLQSSTEDQARTIRQLEATIDQQTKRIRILEKAVGDPKRRPTEKGRG